MITAINIDIEHGACRHCKIYYTLSRLTFTEGLFFGEEENMFHVKRRRTTGALLK